MGDPANWEEGAEVWFRSQKHVRQQPSFQKKPQPSSAGGWGSRLIAPLPAVQSPTTSQALGSRQRHPRDTEGSEAPAPRPQASLWVLGTGGAAARPASGSTWEGAVSAATSAPSFFPFPFQHNTPSNSRGDALHKETSMPRAPEETKINSEGRWLLPDLR